MTKKQFIDTQIKKLKKTMYKTEPDLMSEKEENAFRKFLDNLLEELRKSSKK